MPGQDEKDWEARFSSKPLMHPMLLRVVAVVAGIMWLASWLLVAMIGLQDSYGIGARYVLSVGSCYRSPT